MNGLEKIQAIARKHLGGNMESSARAALADSISLWDDHQNYDMAISRAIASIRYSVGVFHPDYQKAFDIKEGKD